MSDSQDDTTADIANLLASPKPASQQLSQSAGQDHTLDSELEEALTRSSTDIIHAFAASINQNAMREANKTEEFRREFKRRLFEAIIRTYVWSTARLTHVVETNEGRLANGVQELLLAHREQGRSSPPPPTMLDRLRARLAELMAAVSRAAEMITPF